MASSEVADSARIVVRDSLSLVASEAGGHCFDAPGGAQGLRAYWLRVFEGLGGLRAGGVRLRFGVSRGEEQNPPH